MCNPFGVSTKDYHEEQSKTSRKRTEMGRVRLRGEDFVKKEGKQIAPGNWTDIETLILVEIVTIDCTDDLNEICILYNTAIKTASWNGMKCTKKTTNTIQLEHFQKHGKLNLLCLEEQISSYLELASN